MVFTTSLPLSPVRVPRNTDKQTIAACTACIEAAIAGAQAPTPGARGGRGSLSTDEEGEGGQREAGGRLGKLVGAG